MHVVCQAFSTGQSHMGIVCDNQDTAEYLNRTSDRIITQLHDGTYQYDNLEDHNLMGILTLENVIERILKMDIHDEKDIERATILHKMPTMAPSSSGRLHDVASVPLLRRGKSIIYAYDNDDDEDRKSRTVSTNQVVQQSQFMLKFTQKLENLIVADLVDKDRTKSNYWEAKLRSVSGDIVSPTHVPINRMGSIMTEDSSSSLNDTIDNKVSNRQTGKF
jgi:hypothetical protein